MNIIIRILFLVIVVPSTYYFTYWVPFSFLPIDGQHWIKTTGALFVALLVGWFIWSLTKNKTPKNLLSTVFLGAIIVGGVGFFGGFFGPIIFTPNANQGPLLGIFITGPLGFILGGVGGFVYCLMKNKNMTNENI